MKKMLILLMALFLPVYALAEAPVSLVRHDLTYSIGEAADILDCAVLPEGGVLLNVRSTANLDGSGEGDWTHLSLVHLDPKGVACWQTRYSATLGNLPYDRITWAVDKNSVTVKLFSGLIGRETCQQTDILFDLETGRQIGGPYTFSIPSADVPTITHTGDFRIEEYFGDYSGTTTRTVITHIPTGSTAEYELNGQRTWHAFKDKLVSFRSAMQDGGRYWVYSVDCLPVTEAAEMPETCSNPVVGHTARAEDALYLFVWSNRENPDHRTYTVFPLGADMEIGAAVTTFTLEEGHTLGAAAVCGEGFLLTDCPPWVWGTEVYSSLCYLDMDGKLTVLETDFASLDSLVTLLPGEKGQARVVLLDEQGRGYVEMTYASGDIY